MRYKQAVYTPLRKNDHYFSQIVLQHMRYSVHEGEKAFNISPVLSSGPSMYTLQISPFRSPTIQCAPQAPFEHICCASSSIYYPRTPTHFIGSQGKLLNIKGGSMRIPLPSIKPLFGWDKPSNIGISSCLIFYLMDRSMWTLLHPTGQASEVGTHASPQL